MAKIKTRSLKVLDKILDGASNYKEYGAIRHGFTEEEHELWFERELTENGRFLSAISKEIRRVVKKSYKKLEHHPRFDVEAFQAYVASEVRSSNGEIVSDWF